MPGDFWESAAKLGDAALDFDPGPEREAFIDRACGDDSSLRTEVVKYIAGADESQPLLDSPLVPSEESPDKRIGQSVRVWRLLRVLGDGGFGVVYLGERNDGQVRQLGAVKFLKGTVRSRDIETRFLDERQILANLNHPYIVGMIDAGVTAEGQPYLVMDYVEDGKPIDIYAEEKGLSVRARIELIEKVCEAVSYANLHEVIHRDLKPSNILIATDGTPRLLDFGLAKLLNPMHRASKDEALASRIVQMGSERYMSPEQARSESTSVATDVYSLGIILFELLTGTDPYDLDRRAKENIQHVICTVEPESPSRAALRGNVVATEDTGNLNRRRKDRRRLQKDLAGDIDTILKMALRKEPERRYRSVADLRSDLARHFQHEPLLACKDSRWYRTTRYIRRNVYLVAAAATGFLFLSAGLVSSLTLWRRAVAEQRQTLAEKVDAVSAGLQRSSSGQIEPALLLGIESQRLRNDRFTNAQLGLLLNLLPSRPFNINAKDEISHRLIGDTLEVVTTTKRTSFDLKRNFKTTETIFAEPIPQNGQKNAKLIATPDDEWAINPFTYGVWSLRSGKQVRAPDHNLYEYPPEDKIRAFAFFDKWFVVGKETNLFLACGNGCTKDDAIGSSWIEIFNVATGLLKSVSIPWRRSNLQILAGDAHSDTATVLVGEGRILKLDLKTAKILSSTLLPSAVRGSPPLEADDRSGEQMDVLKCDKSGMVFFRAGHLIRVPVRGSISQREIPYSTGALLAEENSATDNADTHADHILDNVVTFGAYGLVQHHWNETQTTLFGGEPIESVHASTSNNLLVVRGGDFTSVVDRRSFSEILRLPFSDDITISDDDHLLVGYSHEDVLSVWAMNTLASIDAARSNDDDVFVQSDRPGSVLFFALPGAVGAPEPVENDEHGSPQYQLRALAKKPTVNAAQSLERNRLRTLQKSTVSDWDLRTGEQVFVSSLKPSAIEGTISHVQSAFSPSGLLVLSWFDACIQPRRTVFGLFKSTGFSCAMSPRLVVWNAETGAPLFKTEDAVDDIVVSPDERHIAVFTREKELRVYDVFGRQLLISDDPLRAASTADRVSGRDSERVAEFSADGRLFAMRIHGGDVSVYDADTFSLLGTVEHSGSWLIRHIRIGYDDPRLIVEESTNEGAKRERTILWRASDTISYACSRLNGKLDQESWRQIFGTLPYQSACESLPQHKATAIAFINIEAGSHSAGLWAIDANGVRVGPPSESDASLPLLIGLYETKGGLRQYLRLMQDLGPQLAKQVSAVNVSDTCNLRVTLKLENEGVELLLGNRNFHSRFKNFLEHYSDVHQKIPGATSFDLRLDDRITAL